MSLGCKQHGCGSQLQWKPNSLLSLHLHHVVSGKTHEYVHNKFGFVTLQFVSAPTKPSKKDDSNLHLQEH